MLGIVLPLVIFWVACIRFLSPLPVLDDYDAVLLYLAHLHQASTWTGRLAAVLFHQHNEYKPIWANAVIAVQYGLSGHANLVVLSLLGDLQVMLLAWLLWRCFAPAAMERARRIALFVPLALIIFQINYAETLNWPMPGLQNLGVVTFALMAMVLLARPDRSSFAGACAAMTLSIAASGNGFLVYPVGMLLLWQGRRFVRMAPWTLTVALCSAVYFTHYARRAPATAGGAPQALWHVPLFILSFLGSFGGAMLPVARYCSLPFGIAIVFVVVVAVLRRYDRINPAVAGFAVFLLLTALGVAMTRGRLGYDQSLSGRYKLYSDLLLACAYCFGLHASSTQSAPVQKTLHKLALIGACIFFVVGTTFGLRALGRRYRSLNDGMALYKASGGTEGPVPLPADSTAERQTTAGFNAHFRDVLKESSHEDVYQLP